MRKVFMVVLVLLASLPLLTVAADPSADQMLAQANAYVNFPDSATRMHMEVLTDQKVEVEYDMNVMKLDSQRMRIEFLQPASEKGRKVLRVGNKMWMFLPDLGKPIVISARQSFLGSSFSNGDMLRTDLVADYLPSLLREEELPAGKAWLLELRARSPEVSYDRILMWVEKGSMRPLRQEFFTLSGKRIKTISYSKPSKLSGVEINTVMEVVSDLNPHEQTKMTISALSTNQKLTAALFQKDSFAR